jgi:hypothetical protein
MLLHFCVWIYCAIVLAMSAGCDQHRSALGERPELGETHESIIAKSNELALKLYGGLSGNSGNVVISPY